jgi:electron transport complex protein RnfB
MKKSFEDIVANIKKSSLRAVIREAECIGCTKCIQACPFDSILGAAKQMHTVITDACTGCELCVEPCPVDCIDMVESAEKIKDFDQYFSRFQAKEIRDEKEKMKKNFAAEKIIIGDKKNYIKDAVNRSKKRKVF